MLLGVAGGDVGEVILVVVGVAIVEVLDKL